MYPTRLNDDVPAGKIAVLASVGFLLDPVVTALAADGIHVVRVGDDPAASSDFARALRAALVLATSPDQERARVRLERLLGGRLDQNELDALRTDLGAHRTTDSFIRHLAEVVGLPLDHQNVWTARQVAWLLQRETGTEPPAAVGRRLALEWHRLSRQLQREAHAVKAMTTFVAKGLEFDTVIVPGFNQGLVPYARTGTTQNDVWWMEKRREMYVAVTRAENRVYLMARNDRAASRFMGELAIRADEHFRWTEETPF